MAVTIRKVATGPAFRLYAIGRDDDCPLLEFLTELERDNKTEFKRISALLERTAVRGPPTHDIERCRYIPEIGGFELKTPSGVRVTAFYDAGRLIICTHGFLKKKRKTPPGELDRAKAWRQAYFAGQQDGTLVRQEETP